MEIAITSLSDSGIQCAAQKEMLTAPFVRHSDLTSSTLTIIARVIVHRKPFIDLRQGAFISRYDTCSVRSRMRGHLLPDRSHLRVVVRALKVAARQIARDVR